MTWMGLAKVSTDCIRPWLHPCALTLPPLWKFPWAPLPRSSEWVAQGYLSGPNPAWGGCSEEWQRGSLTKCFLKEVGMYLFWAHSSVQVISIGPILLNSKSLPSPHCNNKRSLFGSYKQEHSFHLSFPKWQVNFSENSINKLQWCRPKIATWEARPYVHP